MDLQKLNCNNYHVQDSNDDFWYAQNGLRSLKVYAEVSDKTLRELCTELLKSGQIVVNDIRDNDNDQLIISLI